MIRVYVLEVGELRRQMERSVPLLSGWDKLTDWQREKVARYAAPGAGALCMGGQLLLQYGACEWSASPGQSERREKQAGSAHRAMEEEMVFDSWNAGPTEKGISWHNVDLSRICRTIPAPQPLQVACEARGKPYILHVPWHYNLSHSGDYAALAISDAPVGIDIQQMQPYRDSLVQRFFSAEEVAAYEKLVSAKVRGTSSGWLDAVEARRRNTVVGQLFHDGASLFYTLWCRKEAYGKLLGTGLTEKVLKCNMLGDMDVYLYESGELPGYRICVCSRDRADSGGM